METTTSPSSTTETNHQRFLSHLDESEAAVWRIAAWLKARGNSVTIKAAGRAGSHGDWEDHADSGDLEIVQRVEVKKLSAEFTSVNDWPFPDMIVCAKHAWDRAVPKPYCFFYLADSGKYAAIIFGDSHARWTTDKRKDRRYENVEQDFYIADKREAKFVKL